MGDLARPLVAPPPNRALIGVAACAACVALALALQHAFAVPPVLSALILGIAARRLPLGLESNRGVNFCATTLLRLGIALIGFKLSLAQLAQFGAPILVLGVGAVALMLSGGYLIGRLLRLQSPFAMLTAGSVGICGASAALAISAVLPAHPERDRRTVYAICAVTLLSTLAMVLYPLIAHATGLDDTQAGLFLGASIHDLTQVMGAGALVSPEATEMAVATKLVRVACLAPAVVLIGVMLNRKAAASDIETPPLVPWFLLAFVGAAVLVNVGAVPAAGVTLAGELTTMFLVAATAALGMKTSAATMLSQGWRPVAALMAQTALLAAFAIGGVWLLV